MEKLYPFARIEECIVQSIQNTKGKTLIYVLLEDKTVSPNDATTDSWIPANPISSAKGVKQGDRGLIVFKDPDLKTGAFYIGKINNPFDGKTFSDTPKSSDGSESKTFENGSIFHVDSKKPFISFGTAKIKQKFDSKDYSINIDNSKAELFMNDSLFSITMKSNVFSAAKKDYVSGTRDLFIMDPQNGIKLFSKHDIGITSQNKIQLSGLSFSGDFKGSQYVLNTGKYYQNSETMEVSTGFFRITGTSAKAFGAGLTDPTLEFNALQGSIAMNVSSQGNIEHNFLAPIPTNKFLVSIGPPPTALAELNFNLKAFSVHTVGKTKIELDDTSGINIGYLDLGSVAAANINMSATEFGMGVSKAPGIGFGAGIIGSVSDGITLIGQSMVVAATKTLASTVKSTAPLLNFLNNPVVDNITGAPHIPCTTAFAL